MQPEEKHNFTQPSEASYIPTVPSEQALPVEANDQEIEQSTVIQDEMTTSDASLSEVKDEDKQSDEALHWQASEYFHHDRGAIWYVVLGVVVVILMAIALFLIKSWTFMVLIPVMAVALVMYVRRPPTMIDYTLSPKGLFINDTLHGFNEFKAFGVIHDGHEYSVSLIPVNRFRPSLSVYFPEESGEVIVDMLGVRLPMEQLKPDVFDRIVKFLHI